MIEKWYEYLLFCDQKTFYVGITNNLVNRYQEHRLKNHSLIKSFLIINWFTVRNIQIDIVLLRDKMSESKEEVDWWKRWLYVDNGGWVRDIA